MTTMLKSIYLSQGYGQNAGVLTGQAEFKNEFGEVKITIKPEHAARIVQILAEALVETTKETAKLMTSQIIEQAGLAIEGPAS